MKKLILEVLEDMADGAPAGLTLASPSYRSAIAKGASRIAQQWLKGPQQSLSNR